MKNFNLEIRPLFPFTIDGEVLAKSVILYKVRDGHGTHKWLQCDWLEIENMLVNRRFFDDLVWLDVNFEVYDVEAKAKKYRYWRFCESAAGWHYWFDQDNGKWYQQDDEHTVLDYPAESSMP